MGSLRSLRKLDISNKCVIEKDSKRYMYIGEYPFHTSKRTYSRGDILTENDLKYLLESPYIRTHYFQYVDMVK
jgi:hypothetical protein